VNQALASASWPLAYPLRFEDVGSGVSSGRWTLSVVGAVMAGYMKRAAQGWHRRYAAGRRGGIATTGSLSGEYRGRPWREEARLGCGSAVTDAESPPLGLIIVMNKTRKKMKNKSDVISQSPHHPANFILHISP
jgi:hypothetical protein